MKKGYREQIEQTKRKINELREKKKVDRKNIDKEILQLQNKILKYKQFISD